MTYKSKKNLLGILFNKPLKVLLGTNVLILVSGYMFIPIYAIFVEKIGGNLMDAGFAAGIFALSAAIVTFFLRSCLIESVIVNIF